MMTAATPTTLTLTIPAPKGIDARTWAAKCEHPATRHWVAGQLWAWDGGDAITVVTGTLGNECWFVVRQGDSITIEQARSITHFFRARGIAIRTA